MADFTAGAGNQKDKWYTKFYNAGSASDSGTPLREALSRVGRYYAHVTTGINTGMTGDPIQYSCQQNFTILSTDGYWNGNAGKQLDGTRDRASGLGPSTAPRPLLDGSFQLTEVTGTDTLTQRICTGNATPLLASLAAAQDWAGELQARQAANFLVAHHGRLARRRHHQYHAVVTPRPIRTSRPVTRS